MNVVRLVDYFPPYKNVLFGLQPTFYFLSREQAKLDLNVYVICKGFPRKKRQQEIDGVRVYRVATPYNLTVLYELLKLDSQIPIDIIHTHATSGFSYAMLRSLLRKTLGIPYVAHVHGTTLGIMSSFRRLGLEKEGSDRGFGQFSSVIREKIIWRNADAVVANSQFLKSELTALYGIQEKKIHVVHNGVDIDTFYPRNSKKRILQSLGWNLKNSMVLYLGGFRSVKGPLQVLKAFERVSQRVKTAKLLLVTGQNQLNRKQIKTAKELINKLQKKRSIKVIENIPHALMPDYYSAADALIVPSVYDAFPKVVLEGLACGTTVIASSVGGIPEIINQSNTGILVHPKDTKALTDAIISTLSDQPSRERYNKQAHRIVMEHFTWRKAAKDCLNVYKEVLQT